MVETLRELAEQWVDGELHARYPDHVKKKRSADDDRWRFEKHIYPILGTVALAGFSLEHAELVMHRLPIRRTSRSQHRCEDAFTAGER